MPPVARLARLARSFGGRCAGTHRSGRVFSARVNSSTNRCHTKRRRLCLLVALSGHDYGNALRCFSPAI